MTGILRHAALIAMFSVLSTGSFARDRAPSYPDDRHAEVEGCIAELSPEAKRSPLPLRAVPLGPRDILVLIVDFADVTVAGTYGVADPKDYVAGVMYDNTRNSAGVIADASWGLSTLEPDADGDGQHDIFQLSIASSMIGSSCLYSNWANEADAEAQAMGIDLGLYDHRMYVIPRVSGVCSSWSGYAFIGGSRSWIRTTTATIYAHEIGHNLGMHHASTDPDNDGVINSEYGDLSDIMGSSSAWRQFNGPHKVQMDWLPPGAIVDLFGPGPWTFTIDALEIDPNLAVNPQIVRASRPNAPTRPYYFSYRALIGYDQTLSSLYRNRLQIHTATGTATQTLYIDGLSDLEVYQDPLAHDLVVTQLSHDATTVTIEVLRTEPDLDSDGFGETVDCDDGDATVYPGAPEICDHQDNNCDTVVDEGFGACDIDQDGFDELVDCDDGNPEIFPGAPELCDYRDNNCDGFADEPDWDGDGAGNCVDICPEDPNKGGGIATGDFFWCPCGVSEDADEDGDQIPDCADNCPGDPDHGTDDADNDGIPDCIDQCPNDPMAWNPAFTGRCPCGVPTEDSDGDLVWDCDDLCPGVDDRIDADNDGIPDCADLCPTDPWKIEPGACGCGVVEGDADSDTLCDVVDNCAHVPNPMQADTDSDGLGDACDCDPGDSQESTPIGPATELHFTSPTDYAWQAPVDTGGGAVLFDVLRSTDPEDFSSADCAETGIAATTGVESDTPTHLYCYLIRTIGVCGDHLGMASPESRRTGADCP